MIVKRIAIAGLGIVGRQVAEMLLHHSARLSAQAGCPLILQAVSAKTQKDRGLDLDGIAFESDASRLAMRDDIDIVVELIGGGDGIALELCQRALHNKKHVVTANKALIAHHGPALAQIAEQHATALLFEAAVAGGIPALKILREGLGANEIHLVTGILNGTCNYILSEMTKTGRPFDEVLQEAQAQGFAEADPSFDIDGIDAGHKLAILAMLAYHEIRPFESVQISGIRSITAIDIAYAGDLGYVIKLLATAKPGQPPQVRPCLIAKASQLAQVDGALNAVHYHGTPIQTIICTGQGAGAGPTASAVLADIIDIARDRAPLPFGVPLSQLKSPPKSSTKPQTPPPKNPTQSRYYMRAMVRDEIGVLSRLTSILQENQISVASMVQDGQTSDASSVALVFTTHPTDHLSIMHATRQLTGQLQQHGTSALLALPIVDDVS